MGALQKEDIPPVYVRKPREPYSGMVLESMFRILRGAVVIIVVIGILLMLDPLVFD